MRFGVSKLIQKQVSLRISTGRANCLSEDSILKSLLGMFQHKLAVSAFPNLPGCRNEPNGQHSMRQSYRK